MGNLCTTMILFNVSISKEFSRLIYIIGNYLFGFLSRNVKAMGLFKILPIKAIDLLTLFFIL